MTCHLVLSLPGLLLTIILLQVHGWNFPDHYRKLHWSKHMEAMTVGCPAPVNIVYSLTLTSKVRETSQKRGWCDTCKSQFIMCLIHLLPTVMMCDFFFIGYCFFLQLGYEFQPVWPAFHHSLYFKICFYRKWKKKNPTSLCQLFVVGPFIMWVHRCCFRNRRWKAPYLDGMGSSLWSFPCSCLLVQMEPNGKTIRRLEMTCRYIEF